MPERESDSSVSSEEERKRLVNEITKIKDVLDSFKYGLNFEDFADAIFKTIDRHTIAIKNLDDRMAKILNMMERLEARFNEGVKVTVSGMRGQSDMEGASDVAIIGEVAEEEEPEAPADIPREKIEAEIAELRVKIGRLYEKENEFDEMAMNDPAGAEEYQEKARVAREMRTSLEEQMKSMQRMLE